MRVTPAAAFRAFKRSIHRPKKFSARASEKIVSRFHELYYYSRKRTWENTFWLDVPTAKCPLDLWSYQEIILDTKPDFIIESGTSYGGSALFLASVCDLVKRGRVITIDLRELPGRPEHERIKYLTGSSTSESVVEKVKSLIEAGARVMVILDSDHSLEHVLRELNVYGELVTPGNYLIVEDTNVNGHPVSPLYGAGPMEAVERFTSMTEKFVPDLQREKFFMTFNPKGYLLRVE